MFGQTLIIAVCGYVTTLLLLAAWLRYAPRRLLAVPNERSFHAVPTPTGGGLALVLPLMALLLWFFTQGADWAGALGLGTLVVALLGLADDLWDLSAPVRLGVQASCVIGVCWVAGGFGELFPALPAWLTLPLVVFGSLWFLNLYNFMDGIDGLAALQACSYCLGAAVMIVGDYGWLSTLLWVIFATSLAFLTFNWAPARIFMGDVGSAFLGALLALLALRLAQLGALPLVCSLILLSAFWFDASYTLCVRILTAQRFTKGHRSHLYQKLAARYGHGRTATGYLAFSLLWLWPIALAAQANAGSNQAGLVSALGWCMLACAPLAIGCYRLRAGHGGPETRNEF